MKILRNLFATVLCAYALLGISAVAFAMEGMTTGPEHSSVKETIQTDYATSAQLDNAVIVLRRMISENEVQFGKTSRQVGVLLCDIGEVAFKQANYLSGTQKTDKLKRAAAALVAGADMLKLYQGEHDGFIIQRARAYRFAGMAYLQLGDKKSAESSLRNGLAIHWKRYNDNAYQLQFFPALFDAVDGADAKRKVAEAEIKIARNVYNIPTGDGHASLDGPLKRLRMAETDGNPLISQLEAARAKSSELAAQGNSDGAYAELSSVFTAVKGDGERALFVGRMKPQPFFIYDDPDAGRPPDYNAALKMDAYDHVATRFLVDRNLMPFISADRNALFELLAIWRKIYGEGDRAEAAYFCRLMPPGYTGYEPVDLPGYDQTQPGLPPFCTASVEWARWMRLQGNIGEGTAYLEMGIDLLPADARDSPDGKKFLVDSLRELSMFEAYYGSPDSFLSAYERLSDVDAKPPAELAFYASIVRDDPAGFQDALTTLGARMLKPGDDEEGPGPVSKLSVIGPKIVDAICAAQPKELPAIVRGSICIEKAASDVDTLRADLQAALERDESKKRKPFFAVPDWRLLALLDDRKFEQLRPLAKKVFSPGMAGDFQDRKLSSRERKFLESPRDYDAYSKQQTFQASLDDKFSKDFDAAILAVALYDAGKADMARSWATAALERYESASPPQTLTSLWLAEAYEEETYRDGWRWLIMQKPLLASAAFTKHVPKSLSYSRGGQSMDTQSSLDWERVIGAYHGRIVANERLGDSAAAREDARGLVSYVRFVLGLQSFSRNETREVIVRIARPALNEALDVLVDGSELTEDDLEAVFQMLQMMKPSGTGATIARLAGRLSTVSPKLADLAKQREELRQQWLTMPPDQSGDRKALAIKVDQFDAELAKQFPRYVEIAGTVAVPAVQLAQNLREKEALIAFLDTGETYLVMAVTPTKAFVIKTAISSQDVDGLVRELRRGLELRGGRLPAFRSEAAYQLYRQLFEPIEAKWGLPPEHLILVPDGALESIPFAVLLTGEMRGDDFVNGKWLSDRYVVTRVPSVASLAMLRTGTGAKVGSEPFLGVGDPALEGDPDTERGGVGATKIAALRSGANVNDIRALPRLPETADELRALQKTFNASEGSLLLRQNATETVLKGEDLTRFQTLAFATHGLLAGEISGFQEAGLIMTPPMTATPIDDGYLSASDIAALNLNADVVLLSACNTAAPEQVGAEGLSGLAKAFFFAGARNLVVSHWAVDSTATAALTTAMFEYKAKADHKSYAAALGNAMRDLRSVNSGRFAHPLYWGPFEVVGAD